MDNQHEKIKGYRDLSQEEIDLMNEIKGLAAEAGVLVDRLREQVLVKADGRHIVSPIDQRWVSIGQTQLQTGFMSLVRSVARPDSF